MLIINVNIKNFPPVRLEDASLSNPRIITTDRIKTA